MLLGALGGTDEARRRSRLLGPRSRTVIATGARLPISAFFVAGNEAGRIVRAIESVHDWVDEVVVIDGGSTEETAAMCKMLSARIVSRAWTEHGSPKRYGEELCRNNWILHLDACEEVPPETRAEIEALFREGEPKRKAFTVTREAIFRFETNPHAFVVSTTCIRLYDRRYARYRMASNRTR